MNENLEKQLYLIDPVFFEEAIACINKEMNSMNTCMAFGRECGDGWFEPIKSLAMKTHMINEMGKLYNVKFVCNQLKEKFGEVRIYTSTNKINSDEDFKPGYEVLDKLFDDAISTCELECSKVCEICGAPGGNNNENIIQTSGWIRFICKKCAIELSEDSTKQYDKFHKDNEFYGIDRITLFKQENHFLNLYHICPFTYVNDKNEDSTFRSIIEAYFSIKNPEYYEIYKMISRTKSLESPFIIEEIAKRNGYKINDYELLKNIVKAKFFEKWNETIRRDLLLTKNKLLINMNNRHDNVLGYCFCEKCKDIEKQNIFGKILMDVRTELQNVIEERFFTFDEANDFKNRINIKLNIFEATNKSLTYIKEYFVTNKSDLNDKDWDFLLISED